MSPAWIAPTIMVAGAACLVFATFALGPARAAERTIAGPHEIVWYRAGADYRIDAPNVARIEPPYASRETCLIAIKTVRVRESGVRLRCEPVEGWRTR